MIFQTFVDIVNGRLEFVSGEQPLIEPETQVGERDQKQEDEAKHPFKPDLQFAFANREIGVAALDGFSDAHFFACAPSDAAAHR